MDSKAAEFPQISYHKFTKSPYSWICSKRFNPWYSSSLVKIDAMMKSVAMVWYKSAQYDEWKRNAIGFSNKIDYRNRRTARLILRRAATNSTSSNRSIVQEVSIVRHP